MTEKLYFKKKEEELVTGLKKIYDEKESYTEKRFEIKIGEFEEENIIDNLNKITIREISDMCKKMNELYEENERLKRINKGQELEIVRLHNLADAMSGVLRELGIYNVYDDETIEEVKNKVKGN